MATDVVTDDHPDPEYRIFRQRGRHRQQRKRPRRFWATRSRLMGAVAVAVATASAGVGLILPDPAPRSGGHATETPAPSGGTSSSPRTTPRTGVPSPSGRTLVARNVVMDFDGFVSWALADSAEHVTGSTNLTETTWAGSILKVWIVADFLHGVAVSGSNPTPTQLRQARRAIRDSDDLAAGALYQAAGGPAQIQRMISTCELVDTSIRGTRWRDTRISARDAARLGACIVDGRAAGAKWTPWVRGEMTKVRGSVNEADQPYGGRWGIIDGLPSDVLAGKVGITNGWLVVQGEWQVNCLGVADDWALAVLLRYPAEHGLRYGAEACAEVARQLVSPAPPGPAD